LSRWNSFNARCVSRPVGRALSSTTELSVSPKRGRQSRAQRIFCGFSQVGVSSLVRVSSSPPSERAPLRRLPHELLQLYSESLAAVILTSDSHRGLPCLTVQRRLKIAFAWSRARS